MLFNSFFGNFR